MQLKVHFVDPKIDKDEQPCAKAYLRRFVKTERLPLPEDKALAEALVKYWKSNGGQHRQEDNMLYRDVEESSWFFEWLVTGAFTELVDKYGPVVLRRCVDNPKMWELVIGAGSADDTELMRRILTHQHYIEDER